MVTSALIAYALVLLAIALFAFKKNSSMEEFIVAGRNQNRVLVVASMLASTIGGGLTIGTVQKAAVMGFPAFWFVAAGALAHFLQGLLLSRRVRESQALTMAELADKLAGKAARLLTSWIILVTWIGIAAAQFVAVARVLTTLTGLSHGSAVMAAALFITIYTLIGGQKSVLRTDFFQFGVLAVALLATLAWLFLATPPPAGSIRVELFTSSFGPLDLVYYVVVMGGSYFICPMMFGRILSSDTAANARKSSFMSGVGMLIFAVVVTFIGLWVKAGGFDSGKLDPLNAIASRALPGALGVVLVFGLLAAIISTADTVLITAASIIQNDLVQKPSVAMVRLWTLAVGAMGAFVAVFHTDVIGLLIRTYNGYTAGLVPALLVAILKGSAAKRRVRPELFAAGIVVGYLLGMGGSFALELGTLLQLDSALINPLAKGLPLAGMAVSGLLALLAYGKKAPAGES